MKKNLNNYLKKKIEIYQRAFSKENYHKWGNNYLFSMLRFQILEQCGNFRDMSLQLFSNNETFLKFRKFGNKVFMSLPIPQRSHRKRPTI